MKNVMKKLAGLLMVLSVALFAGCSDSSDRANEAPQTAKTYTVSGKISIGSAVPADLAKSIASASEGASSNARTATTSFDLETTTYEKSKTNWVAEAISVDDDNNSDNDIYIYGEIDPVEMTYSFKLPEGKWSLMLSLQGEYREGVGGTLIYNKVEVIVEDNIEEDIILSPQDYQIYKNGALSLPITDGTTDHKIKTVTCALVNWTERNADDEALIKDSLETAIANLKKPKNFSSSGTVTIVQNDVPAGSYEATFTFKDENGNALYVCKENITVFSGWTTDTWLGAGAHLQLVDGETNFVITDALVEGYGTELVSPTKMALFNVHTERNGDGTIAFNGYKYYISADGDDIDENTEENYKASNSDSASNPINSFIFDNNGYFYTLHITYSGGTSYYIYTNNPKVSGEQVEVSATHSPSRLAYDSKTDIIYLVSINEEAMYLYQLPSLASEGTVNDIKQVYCSDYYKDGVAEFSSCHYKMCIVHDGVVYSIVRGNYDSKGVRPALVISKVSESNTNKPAASGVQILSTDMKNANDKYGDITDLLYQDGAVYMLYRDVSDTSSRGALIRYDVKFGGIKVLGLTDNKLEKEDFTNAKLGVYYNGSQVLMHDSTDPAVFAGNSSWTSRFLNYTLKDFIKTLRTPAPLSETPDLTVKEFFGPVKFIAIKPKKLVIADDGIAFYTDNDLLKYKNVNRIVTVDLESFSIIEASLVNVFFNGDDSDVKPVVPIPNTGSTDPQDVALIDGRNAMLPASSGGDGEVSTTYNYFNTENESVDLSDVVFGIPCGD